ncbi:MAG: divergent polysaccharide deacetylase family protein [Candidatus Marinimicrobia bacterium]|nr:divergent polysaccharide deacetylase family protein [Candidatus Neomarinimicrobiota bacterium]
MMGTFKFTAKNILTILIFLVLLVSLPASIYGQNPEKADQQFSAEELKGKDILMNQVKYSLNYIGLRLCEPIPNQENYTVVYKLSFKEVTDKILAPIQQVLEQHGLKAGELVRFPGNRGFKYFVLFENKHIGYICVLNEKSLDESKKYIPVNKFQPEIRLTSTTDQQPESKASVKKDSIKTQPTVSETTATVSVKTAKKTPLPSEPETIKPQVVAAPEKYETQAQKTEYENIEPFVDNTDEPEFFPSNKPFQTPRIAIIIDDFGYSNNGTVQKFLNSNLPLTISIIPGHQYSTWTSEQAHAAGKEVMIHMPMESDNYRLNNGENQFILTCDLDEKEIIDRVIKACDVIHHARGMNNHMGSIATTQPIVVLPLIKALQLKGLYFIDSLTSPLSIMYENCVISNIPTARRRFFIDNQRDTAAIIAELRRAIRYAKNYGNVIVTGHTYNETLEALNFIDQSGEFSVVEVCPASELLH